MRSGGRIQIHPSVDQAAVQSTECELTNTQPSVSGLSANAPCNVGGRSKNGTIPGTLGATEADCSDLLASRHLQVRAQAWTFEPS